MPEGCSRKHLLPGYPFIFFCGICMGAADLIPGISGGTVAFIMGFYYQLLDSIKTINPSSLKLLFSGHPVLFFKAVAWQFLLTLVAGISFSFIALAGFVHFILEHEVYRTYFYSMFFGLIVASFWFCVRQVTKWNQKHIAGLVLGALTAYLSAGPFVGPGGDYAVKIELGQNLPPLSNYDLERGLLTFLSQKDLSVMVAKQVISDQSIVYDALGEEVGVVKDLMPLKNVLSIDIWIMFCGALAVCALLLPGISGSYLLTLLGVYPSVIEALADLTDGLKSFTLDWDAFYLLSSLALGIILGLLIFSRFVSWLIRCHSDFTIATLSGFMIGAIGSVWPFWNYVLYLNPLKIHKGPQLALLAPVFPPILSKVFIVALFFALAGFYLVIGIERLSSRKPRRIPQ
jgi:putative membrane protein